MTESKNGFVNFVKKSTKFLAPVAIGVGVAAAGLAAVATIKKLDEHEERLNFTDERRAEYVESLNQLLEDVRELKN